MKYTLSEFLMYLKNERNYSDLTIKSYREDLLEFLKICNLKELYEGTKIDIKKYLKYLHDQNKSNTTICRKMSTLKSYYKYLSKRSSYPNIMNDIKLPKKVKKLPSFVNYSDLEEILKISSEHKFGSRNNLIIELLYATGVRVSELVNIKLGDINFSDKTIRILGKGNKERIVYFGEYAEEAMLDYINNLRCQLLDNKETDFLFLNKYGCKISDRSIRNIIEDIIKRSSVKMHVSPHTIRHTFATHLLTEGCDLKSVQYLLGHENLSTTQIYTHVTDEALRNIYLHSHPRAESEDISE